VPSRSEQIAEHRATAARPGWRPLAGGSAEISSLTTFYSPFVGVERAHAAWPLGVRVGALFGGHEVNEPDAHTRTSWLAARIQLCPWQLELTRAIRLQPCGALDLGRVTTVVVASPGVTSALSVTDAWVVPRLEARLGWDALRWLRIEATTGLTAPVSRREWAEQRLVAATHGPVVAAGAGALVRFP
jgi:hypothetical protein